LEVEQAGRTWSVSVASPCGAFVVGIESPGPTIVRAADERGQPLRDPGVERTVEV